METVQESRDEIGGGHGSSRCIGYDGNFESRVTKILKAVNVMKFSTMAKLDMAVEIDVAERGTELKADAGELEVFRVRRRNWRQKRKNETARLTFFSYFLPPTWKRRIIKGKTSCVVGGDK